jgi:hypothetical protein
MNTGEPSAPCYLVEWYRGGLIGEQLATSTIEASAASVSAIGSPVCLLAMVVVPADEVVFGIFAASSEDEVTETCRLAGMPAQRITAAVGLGGAAKRVTW